MKAKRLISFILIIINSFNSNGDVIPENHHYVDKCVKITNLSEYDDVSLLGFVPGPMPFKTYLIASENCLQKGYRFNTLQIYAVEKSYLLDKDITTIDWSKENHAIKSNTQIDCGGGFYADTIPLSEINQFYRIIGFTETSVVLFKWKEINKFNNGKPDSVINYSYDGDSTILSKKLILEIPSNQNNASILLFPNPVYKHVNIKFNHTYKGTVSVNIFSSDGKEIKVFSFIKDEDLYTLTIPIENLAKGTYFVNIMMGETIETRKIFMN